MRPTKKASLTPAKGKDSWFRTSTGTLINLDAVEYINETHINGRRWSVAISLEDYNELCALLGFAPPELPPPS